MLLCEMIYKYDPAQPRDAEGKWSEAGGGRSWMGGGKSFSGTLYHNTSESALSSIMLEGLQPTESSRQQDGVYFTRTQSQAGSSVGSTLRVELNRARLAPTSRRLQEIHQQVREELSSQAKKLKRADPQRYERLMAQRDGLWGHREAARRFLAEGFDGYEQGYDVVVITNPSILLRPEQVKEMCGGNEVLLREMVRGKDYDPAQPRDEAGRWSDARWECLRAKALAGIEWGKSFEGHAGRPGHVGGSLARGAGGSAGLGASNLVEWKKLGIDLDVVGNGPDGPIVKLYHGSPRAGEVYESGFASGGRNQYTGRGVEEPGFYVSEKPEYAAQYGDVVTLHVPAKWVELYQTNPLNPELDRGQFLPGNEFLIRWKNSKKVEIQRGIMSSSDILDEYRRSQQEDLSDYA